MTPEALRLQVDWLKIGGAPLLHTAGRIGLSACPGRPDCGAGLEGDLAALQALRIGAVLSLVDEAEMLRYGVAGLPAAVAAAGLLHLPYPIVDGLPPRELPPTRELCLRVLALLGEGATVLLHCIGGWGRSGTIAACLLCHEGHGPRRAIELVRRARHPRCIETHAQELFIHKYAQHQRGYRRAYFFVPRTDVAAHLIGAPGERRCAPGPEVRLVTDADHLTRSLLQLHHHRAQDQFVIVSGEVPADQAVDARGGPIAVDRAYRLSGPALLPVPFSDA